MVGITTWIRKRNTWVSVSKLVDMLKLKILKYKWTGQVVKKNQQNDRCMKEEFERYPRELKPVQGMSQRWVDENKKKCTEWDGWQMPSSSSGRRMAVNDDDICIHIKTYVKKS